MLGQAGVPNHAIMDTSRNGLIGVREDWTEWCNVDGAGFGKLSTSEGTGLDLADAFIWAKGDGISTAQATPHHSTTILSVAKQLVLNHHPWNGNGMEPSIF